MALNRKATGGATRAYNVEYQEKLGTGCQFQRVVTTDASGSIPGSGDLANHGERYYRVTAP